MSDNGPKTRGRASSSIANPTAESVASRSTATAPTLETNEPTFKGKGKAKAIGKHKSASSSASSSSSAAATATAKAVPTSVSTQPFDQSAMARIPTEIWSVILSDIVLTCSLGQLLLFAAACRDLRHLVLTCPDLDRFLAHFAATLGNVQPTPARGKKTPARTLGQNLAKAYGKCCESCGIKGKLNKVGLWPATNAILCLGCRFALLNRQGHPGRPLIHHRGDTIPCTDCKRMGIPEKFVKDKMRIVSTRPNPYNPRKSTINLYDVVEAQRASYAATGSLDPIHLESKEFKEVKPAPAKRGGGRYYESYEEWEGSYGMEDWDDEE